MIIFDLQRQADYGDISVEYTVKETNQKAPGITYTLSEAWSYILEEFLPLASVQVKSNPQVRISWCVVRVCLVLAALLTVGGDGWRPSSLTLTAVLPFSSSSLLREAVATQNISNEGLPVKGLWPHMQLPSDIQDYSVYKLHPWAPC